MKDDQPPGPVSSSAWTGPPPPPPYSGPNQSFRPRWDPVEQRTHAVAGLLLAGCPLAFLAWYVVLGSHSGVVPSSATGQTEALNLFSNRGPPIYVRPAEALITYALLVATFAVPVAYLVGRETLRRHLKR